MCLLNTLLNVGIDDEMKVTIWSYYFFTVLERQSLTFSGSGYARYRLMENENKEEMKLSLRLRTFSTHATVMYAKGTDYSILEVSLYSNRLQRKTVGIGK